MEVIELEGCETADLDDTAAEDVGANAVDKAVAAAIVVDGQASHGTLRQVTLRGMVAVVMVA